MIVKAADPPGTRSRKQQGDAPAQTSVLRILAALDGSESTGLVMKYLLDLRTVDRIEVVLLNVQPKPQEWRTRGYGWFHRKEIEDRLKDVGGRIVRSAARQLEGAGIAHRDRVEIGDPIETILRCAREEGCNLIVLGERDPGLVRRWLMNAFGIAVGSVASIIVHVAPIPVLTAR